MKNPRIKNKFIEELEKVPIISLACEKVGLSRQTIYRWIKVDPIFKKRVDDASDMGTESVCDLAESKLVSNINNGDQRAIEYFLTNNKKKYYRPKKPMSYESQKFIPVQIIRHATYDKKDDAIIY